MSETKTEAYETVKVTIEVPKGIMQFLKDIVPSTEYEDVQKYLEEAVRSRVEGDIENDIFNPILKKVTERYKLEGVFSS